MLFLWVLAYCPSGSFGNVRKRDPHQHGVLSNLCIQPHRRSSGQRHICEPGKCRRIGADVYFLLAEQTLAFELGFGGIEINTWLGPVEGASVAVKRSTRRSTPASCSEDALDVPVPTSLLNNVTLSPHEGDLRWTLLAGHDVLDLMVPRTLSSLYLDPLMERLDQINSQEGRIAGSSWMRVYRDDPQAELVLIFEMVCPVSRIIW